MMSHTQMILVFLEMDLDREAKLYKDSRSKEHLSIAKGLTLAKKIVEALQENEKEKEKTPQQIEMMKHYIKEWEAKQ